MFCRKSLGVVRFGVLCCSIRYGVVICGMMSMCGYMTCGWMCLWHNIYNVAMCGEVCCAMARGCGEMCVATLCYGTSCGEMWEKPAGRGGRNVTGMCRPSWRRKEARGAAAAARQCLNLKTARCSAPMKKNQIPSKLKG